MKCKTILRGLAVLALAALGACDTTRSPTAAEPAAGPRSSTYLLASVTNSGGFPLVSWNAVDGATGYTVRLIFASHNVWPNGTKTPSRVLYYPIVTTTGTSLLDSSHVYTGVHTCSVPYDDGSAIQASYVYQVTATLPNGTSVSMPYAPIMECYE